MDTFCVFLYFLIIKTISQAFGTFPCVHMLLKNVIIFLFTLIYPLLPLLLCTHFISFYLTFHRSTKQLQSLGYRTYPEYIYDT